MHHVFVTRDVCNVKRGLSSALCTSCRMNATLCSVEAWIILSQFNICFVCIAKDSLVSICMFDCFPKSVVMLLSANEFKNYLFVIIVNPIDVLFIVRLLKFDLSSKSDMDQVMLCQN